MNVFNYFLFFLLQILMQVSTSYRAFIYCLKLPTLPSLYDSLLILPTKIIATLLFIKLQSTFLSHLVQTYAQIRTKQSARFNIFNLNAFFFLKHYLIKRIIILTLLFWTKYLRRENRLWNQNINRKTILMFILILIWNNFLVHIEVVVKYWILYVKRMFVSIKVIKRFVWIFIWFFRIQNLT